MRKKNYYFDTSLDSHTQLIGRYPQYDKDQTYHNLNFIIEDSATIQRVLATFVLGKEQPNIIQDPSFRINLIQHYEEVRTAIIHPKIATALVEGHSYTFNSDLLKDLAKKYPFDYRFEKKAFANSREFETYYKKVKEDKAFVFHYAPSFRREGNFDIEFPKNEIFSSPKAISEYLKPYIEKIVKKDDYDVSYSLTDKNLRDQTQFTMTISGSKHLYDKLVLAKLKNESFKPITATGWFFYRTK